MMLLYTVLIPLILYFLWKFYKNTRYWKDQGILEAKSWPIIGSMWGYLSGNGYQEWLQDIYNQHDARYFGMYSFMSPVLFLKDLDLIKQIMIKDIDIFVDHKNFFTESQQPVLKDTLFNLKGESWRQMRATLSPAFTGNKMRTMFNLMKDCADQFTNHFVSNSNTDKAITLNMKDVFSRYTNDVMVNCAFGVPCNSLIEKNNEFYLRAQDVATFTGIRAFQFTLFTAFPALMNFIKYNIYSDDLINFVRNIVTKTIDFREKNTIYRPDMIQLLMQAKKGQLKHEEIDNKADTGFATAEESKYGKDASSIKTKLSDDELAAQVFIFLLAGFETSSTTLSFMAYELAMNVDIQKKLQAEIDKTMKECNGNITYDILSKMQYLDMTLTESLRLWSSVPFVNRVCSKPYTIPAVNKGEKTLHLKANDVIWVPSYAIMRDPKNYPNPLKFDPERFNEENKKNINMTSFLTFGIGPRNCIGSRFALLKTKIIMVYLLWKFDFEIVKETIVPVQLDKTALFLSSIDGIQLGFKLRNKQQ